MSRFFYETKKDKSGWQEHGICKAESRDPEKLEHVICALKKKAGFWMDGFFVCLSRSIYLLYQATLLLTSSTTYAEWAGIGEVGTVVVGIFIFKELATF